MPLYEYDCKACSQVHEVVQKFADAPLSECPVCKGPVEKLMSLGSFALKGTGWYTTDYKRNSGALKKSEGSCSSASAGCAGCPSANS